MRTKYCRMLLVVMGLVCLGYGKENSGLIWSGLDTLWTNKLPGFDFVTQTTCTSFIDYPGCYAHFEFVATRNPNLHYDLKINGWVGIFSEYSMKLGKINLDSVKFAPPDSILYMQPMSWIDSIPPDSLSSRIGNVYVLKTGTDPRPAWNRPFYAKIKILKFIVVDSASHSVKMVFLWAYNNSGTIDLRTSSLDTFHLDSVPTLVRNSSAASFHVSRSSSGRLAFKIIGDKFAIPPELAGKVKRFYLYDLSGKMLGKIEVGEKRILSVGSVKGRSTKPMLLLGE